MEKLNLHLRTNGFIIISCKASDDPRIDSF